MSRRRVHATMSVSFWSVFTDAVLAMLLLLVLFIFAQFLANSRVLGRLMVEWRQERFATELRAALGASTKDVSIDVDGNLQRVRFSDRILFRVGDDKLEQKGKEVLRVVGEHLLKHADWISGIQIEGHTDVTPPWATRNRFPSNWELSSARATSVVRFLHEEVGLNAAKHPLAATGRGEYVPLSEPPASADEETRETHYRKNRRVEVVLAYNESDIVGTESDDEDVQPDQAEGETAAATDSDLSSEETPGSPITVPSLSDTGLDSSSAP